MASSNRLLSGLPCKQIRMSSERGYQYVLLSYSDVSASHSLLFYTAQCTSTVCSRPDPTILSAEGNAE